MLIEIVETYTHILGGGAGDVDPGLGEEGAGAEHEHHVEQRVQRVVRDVRQRLGRAEVVAQPAHRVGAGRPAATHVGPHAQQVHQEVAAELHRQHLPDHTPCDHRRSYHPNAGNRKRARFHVLLVNFQCKMYEDKLKV